MSPYRVIHNTNAKTQNISVFISLFNVLRCRSHTIVIRSFSEKQDTKLKRGFIIWVSVFSRQTAFDCLKTDASTVESISSAFSETSHLSLSSPKGKDGIALKHCQQSSSKLLVDTKLNCAERRGRLFHNKTIFTGPHLSTSRCYSKWNLHRISYPSDIQNLLQSKSSIASDLFGLVSDCNYPPSWIFPHNKVFPF